MDALAQKGSADVINHEILNSYYSNNGYIRVTSTMDKYYLIQIGVSRNMIVSRRELQQLRLLVGEVIAEEEANLEEMSHV